jgi:hypothetical protein
LEVTIADFSHLPTHCKFVALMPQWDFLNFIAEKAKAISAVSICACKCEVTDLMTEDGPRGGSARENPRGNAGSARRFDDRGGWPSFHGSRQRPNWRSSICGAPIDVLWMRISRQPGDPNQTLGRFRAGKILVTSTATIIGNVHT